MVAAVLLAAGCGAPFAARRASPEAVRRALTETALSSDNVSSFSTILLHRQNLTSVYKAEPVFALMELHRRFRQGELDSDALFSLAELSFHYAKGTGARPFYLAAAVYAYGYVFPDDPTKAPDRFDPRLREAVDFYNRSLAEAFKASDSVHVEVVPGVYALPFGELDLTLDTGELRWGDRRLTRFVAAADTEVVGFENRYRSPGVGAPLAAGVEPVDPTRPESDFVGAKVRVPVSLLLRLPDARAQLTREQLFGSLELHAATDPPSVTISSWDVPLEQEPTVALALTLAEARPWSQEMSLFLGRVLQADMGPRFAGREPHQVGKIPVVFVHGTASNPSVWFNMVNDLDSDPVVRRHFDFWVFRYDSGQPILYSGMRLREMLTSAVAAFRSEVGEDPCLDQMVLVGHSQGGLLVKLAVIDSGDRFWRNVSDQPLDEVELTDETRALLRNAMFVEPMPFVKRAVFIATPHRGSYLAGPTLVRRLAQRLITLPAETLRTGPELLGFDKVRQYADLQQLPTSIDNMSPGHPFVETISQIPIAPQVRPHSIVGVVGDGPVEEGGDGVVKYTSAHIEPVESELVVPYPHSMQAKPEVVAEVRRILHLHLEESGGCRASAPAEPE